jgi:hypothetical protein
MRRRLTATCLPWKPAKLTFEAKYLGIMVGPGVTDKSAFAEPLAKYISRLRLIAKMGLGWARAANLHNIFALPVLSYVAQVQGDVGIQDLDLDRAAAIRFRGPMHRPNYAFFQHLRQLGCGTGLRDGRIECQAAAARCSATLSQLPAARRQLAVGSNDDHLTVHPHRQWQDRSVISRLGAWQDRLRRELPQLAAHEVQRQRRQHLRSRQVPLDYRILIKARITTAFRRMGYGPLALVDNMTADLLDSILLAVSILHCTVLCALLRVSQNGLTVGAVGGDSS